MTIKEICDILRAKLYNNGFEYGFIVEGRKYKPPRILRHPVLRPGGEEVHLHGYGAFHRVPLQHLPEQGPARGAHLQPGPGGHPGGPLTVGGVPQRRVPLLLQHEPQADQPPGVQQVLSGAPAERAEVFPVLGVSAWSAAELTPLARGKG